MKKKSSQKEDTCMKILAVDYGDSRTGLATCDRTEFLTSPITPQITVKARDKVAARVCEVAKEIEAELIVIGLPLNMDGTEGERARKSRKLEKHPRLGERDGDIGRLHPVAEGAPGGGLNAPAAPVAKFLCEVRTVCCKVRRKSSFSGLFSQFSRAEFV